MSDDRPTRRDLMKPLQLLGLAFAAALFAGIVTLVSMGFFQQRAPGEAEQMPATLPANNRVPSLPSACGRDIQSSVFFSNAGIEPLYSGVAIRRPSAAASLACRACTCSGMPDASISPS